MTDRKNPGAFKVTLRHIGRNDVSNDVIPAFFVNIPVFVKVTDIQDYENLAIVMVSALGAYAQVADTELVEGIKYKQIKHLYDYKDYTETLCDRYYPTGAGLPLVLLWH